jgi:hypothetical protein
VRYRFTIIPIAFILITCISIIALRQDSRHTWITKVLRVQYDPENNLDSYSGCYRISTDIAKRDKRYVYEGDEYNVNEAKFGYCKDDRKWYLFKGNNTSACETEELDKLAYSDSTYDFDISVTFEESWVRCFEKILNTIQRIQSFCFTNKYNQYLPPFTFSTQGLVHHSKCSSLRMKIA